MKGLGRGVGYALGYILGGAVLIPLIYHLISLVLYTPNKLTEAEINQYMTDTVVIRDSDTGDMIREQERENKADSGEKIKIMDDSLGLQSRYYTIDLEKHARGLHFYLGYIFYSDKYHKYIQLTSMEDGDNGANDIGGNGGFGGSYAGLDNDSFYLVRDYIMTVNKKDFNNPAYGTKANPIPVFKFIGATISIRKNNKDYDQAYMDTVFYNNVKIYLQYIMPKKEFKARFGKG